MSVVESYETAESLSSLAMGCHPTRLLRFLITDSVPTHMREYSDGLVMSLFGTMGPNAQEARLRLNFYDEWATAASFTEPGDIIIMKGFRLVPFPEISDGLPPPPPPRGGKAPEDKRFFVVPIPHSTVFRAIQKDPDTSLTSEVTVDPSCGLDEAKVRVMPVQPSVVCASDRNQ